MFFPLNFWSGDLNPHFFTYPTLQYYLLSLAYLCYFGVQYVVGSGLSPDQFVAFHYFWDRTELLSIARSLSALMGIATVGCTALVARAAYGSRAAVVAAFLMAVCPLHVRQSHLAGVDVALTLWFTGAVWVSLRLLQTNSAGAYLLAGLLVGMAGATKYPGAMAGAVEGICASTRRVVRRSPPSFFARRMCCSTSTLFAPTSSSRRPTSRGWALVLPSSAGGITCGLRSSQASGGRC